MRSLGRHPRDVDTLDTKPPGSQTDRPIAAKSGWRRYGPYVAGGVLALGIIAWTGKDATKRNIRLGRKNPQAIEVLDGLKPGEKVIISGYEAYQKMDRIEFEQSDRSAEQ